MLEDLLYDLLVFDESQYTHLILALGTRSGVHFIYFLDQPGPVFPVFSGRSIRFQNTGYQLVLVVLFPLAPGYVTDVAVISHHLLSLIGDVRTHGR